MRAATALGLPASWPITARRCLSVSGPGAVSGVAARMISSTRPWRRGGSSPARAERAARRWPARAAAGAAARAARRDPGATAALNQLDAVIVTAPDDLRRRLAATSRKQLVRRPRGCGPAGRRHRRAAPDRAAHPAAHRGDRGDRRRTRCLVADIAPAAARRVRCRPGLRRAAARVQRRPGGWQARRPSRPWPAPTRSTRPAANSNAPAQPRRRQTTQLGAPRDRPATRPPPRRDRRLLPATTRRGKTTKEAKRCVKRALARHFYNRLKGDADAALTT